MEQIWISNIYSIHFKDGWYSYSEGGDGGGGGSKKFDLFLVM